MINSTNDLKEEMEAKGDKKTLSPPFLFLKWVLCRNRCTVGEDDTVLGRAKRIGLIFLKNQQIPDGEHTGGRLRRLTLVGTPPEKVLGETPGVQYLDPV